MILVGLVLLHGRFHGEDTVYAYAIAWLVATVVQFLMVACGAVERIEFRLCVRASTGATRACGRC